MANPKIILKHGGNTGFDTLVLSQAEPVFNQESKKFYIGDGTNKILINPLSDTEVTALTGRVTTAETNITDLQGRMTTAEGKVTTLETTVAGYGDVVTYNVGTTEGTIPVLVADGKLPVSAIPSLAITDTFVVASEEDMLGLTAQKGDVAVRSDVHETYILQDDDATQLASWVKLESPTDAVSSVNGMTGAVVVDGTSVKLGTYTHTDASPFTYVSTDALGVVIKAYEDEIVALRGRVLALETTIDGGTY